jgi:NAD(P)-dependent dehydrogenase (short-subunit alcohol dehydrogenase family)
MACVDTSAMQARQWPWSCCSRISFETLVFLLLSYTTSTAEFPGIFRKGITEADPSMVLETLRNSAFSVFLVGRKAAQLMRENKLNANGTKGTIIFTNASAALKGFPSSGAFAMACHAKSGLAQSMAREMMPQGIHIANVPIDAAIG